MSPRRARLTRQLRGPEATLALGAALGRLLAPGAVVLLTGRLGAGKTVLARGLAAGLGVSADYAIVSPTFTLLNQYPGRVAFFHADLYRLAGGGRRTWSFWKRPRKGCWPWSGPSGPRSCGLPRR